jgi:hypothetical protein
MERGNFGIRVINQEAEPVMAGDARLTFRSQAVVLRWPAGGFVWNRPVAVEVDQGGEFRQVPILDLTRLIQVGLWVLWLVIITRAAGRQR